MAVRLPNRLRRILAARPSSGHPVAAWPAALGWGGGLLALAATAIFLCQSVLEYDIWWQMEVGKQLLRDRTLYADHSLYSWTPIRQGFIYCAWLAQIVLYLAQEALCTGGLMLVRAVMYCGCALLFVLTARRSGLLRHPFTWVVALLTLYLSFAASLIKPQMFSYLYMFAVVYAWRLVKDSGERGVRYVYSLPVLACLWANTHGMFMFMAPIPALFWVGELLNSRFSPGEAAPARVRRHLFWSMALCLPAVLATPYGWPYIQQILLNVLHPPGDMRTIGEFGVTSGFDREPIYSIENFVFAMGLLAVFMWAWLRSGRRPDWTLILFNLVYGSIYLVFFRATLFWGPLFAMSALAMLAERDTILWRMPPRRVPWVATALAFISLALAVRGSLGYVATNYIELGVRVSDVLPVDEAAYVGQHYRGRVLGNFYRHGGYLIWALAPHTKVLIDGRKFPYEDWYDDYYQFRNGIGMEGFMARYQAEVWVVGHVHTLANSWFYRSKEWKPVFFGRAATVFVKSSESSPGGEVEVAPAVDDMRNLNAAQHAVLAAARLGRLDIAQRIARGIEPHVWFFSPGQNWALGSLQFFVKGLDLYRDGRLLEALAYFYAISKETRPTEIMADALFRLSVAGWGMGREVDALAFARLARDLMAWRLSYRYNSAVLEWYAQGKGLLVDSRFPFDGEAASRINLAWKDDLTLAEKNSYLFPVSELWAVDQAKAILDNTFTQRPRLLQPPGAPLLSGGRLSGGEE